MIAKVFVLLAAVAAAQATLIGTGLINGGLINGGLIGSGVGLKGMAPIATAVRTGSVVAIPGAVTTDKRVIGAATMLTGAPLVNGMWGNGMLGHGVWGNGLVSNGMWGNGLVANGMWGNGLVANGMWGNGLVANGLLGHGVLGVRSAGIMAPGMVKTIL